MKNTILKVIDHSMGLLVTGVTRTVEKIYVITCIRPGWYKLFASWSFHFRLQLRLILFDRETTLQRNWDQLANIHMTTRRPYWCSKRWNGGNIGVRNKSCGRWTLYLCEKFFCSHKFAWMMATWVNTLYTKNVKFERDLLTTKEDYRCAKSPNFTDVCMVGGKLVPHHTKVWKFLFRSLLTYHL